MNKILKILLSFSKGERIGLAVLFALLITVFLLPSLIPKSEQTIFDIEKFKRTVDSLSQLTTVDNDEDGREFADYRKSFQPKTYTKEKNYTLFNFDPNTADTSVFQQLGFSSKQAVTIVNYRARGAVFRTPDDFAKVFVVSSEKFDELKSYIQITAIPQTAENTTKYDTTRFQKRIREIVELNSADSAMLVTVTGIGGYTATQIMKYREQLGGFVSVEQLREIRGITEERFEQIAPQVSANIVFATSIDLQTADENTLKKHPYIGAYVARGIVHYRKVASEKSYTIDDLVKNNILKSELAEKLRPYCE